MDIFFKDKDNQYLWENLIDDINNTEIYNTYCNSNSIYIIFKSIIISMIIGKNITLFDNDLTDTEISNFEIIKINIKNKLDLINKLKHTNINWTISLFTSGTTGIPKKISHNFKSITKSIKYSNKKNIWGFSYNPTHISGLQVFLQAILNKNTIINLYGLSTNEIFNEIYENKITHISATPTFYRLLLPSDRYFLSVQRITSGGENFNEQLIYHINKTFPNAKITNIYASTELGSIFASNNNIFTINDKHMSLIKIVNDELFIHKSLVNSDIIVENEWYNTGDIVNVINDSPLQFIFVSRKNSIINSGGYNIDPLEIEEILRSYNNVRDVRVYSKPNYILGNIICCDIVGEFLEEPDIRSYLKCKLQEFKIPRIFNFVDNILTTKSGKIKRK